MPDHSQAQRVDVSAPARLHLGFLDLGGGLGRRFGSLGVAIDGCDTLGPSAGGALTRRSRNRSFCDKPLSLRSVCNLDHRPPR